MSNASAGSMPQVLPKEWVAPNLVDIMSPWELPLAPGDYKVTPGDRWTVTLLKTGETIYSGLGPVEVIRSPAPF